MHEIRLQYWSFETVFLTQSLPYLIHVYAHTCYNYKLQLRETSHFLLPSPHVCQKQVGPCVFHCPNKPALLFGVPCSPKCLPPPSTSHWQGATCCSRKLHPLCVCSASSGPCDTPYTFLCALDLIVTGHRVNFLFHVVKCKSIHTMTTYVSCINGKLPVALCVCPVVWMTFSVP